MSLIFKDFSLKSVYSRFLNSKALETVLDFVKANKTFVKIASFSIVSLIAIIISISVIGLKIGFNVTYGGKVIATVSDTADFENAKVIAAKTINCDAATAFGKAFFFPTLTVDDSLTSTENLATAIIENSEEIVYADALVVNGKTVFCTSGEGLRDLAESRLTNFYVDGAENEAEFVDKVEIKKGYYLKSDLSHIFDAEKVLDKLDVKTVSKVYTESTVKYTVKTIKSSAYGKGFHKVSQKGQNGVTRSTIVIETVNGAQSAEQKVYKQVISEPVEQIEIFGTAPAKAPATEKAEATSKGFICPLNKGTYVVTSYYGDGRNHKGLDLAANRGTAIFAVSAGVVTYAGYDSDFGYNVIIDHGNGIKTRYAHANALCVSQGKKVSQGDMIATVGNTGYSTGNHLHFEVIVNGVRVNPAPYIGM